MTNKPSESVALRHREYVEKAIAYMRDNLSKNVEICDVAAHVHISKYHFSRVFAQVTGDSPKRYLVKLRIEKAKHLLTTTSMTLIQIGEAVGYFGRSAFGDMFNREVGCRPSAYRSRRQHDTN